MTARLSVRLTLVLALAAALALAEAAAGADLREGRGAGAGLLDTPRAGELAVAFLLEGVPGRERTDRPLGAGLGLAATAFLLGV